MLNSQSGDVYLLFCGCIREPKDKFHVVAYSEPRLRYFLINTHAAAFLLANPILAAHQITLKHSEHADFLKVDSVLDCSQIFGGATTSDIEDLLVKGKRVVLGRLSPNARRNVRRAVRDSELLSPVEIEAILAIW